MKLACACKVAVRNSRSSGSEVCQVKVNLEALKEKCPNRYAWERCLNDERDVKVTFAAQDHDVRHVKVNLEVLAMAMSGRPDLASRAMFKALPFYGGPGDANLPLGSRTWDFSAKR